jgi:hypothetical protein
MLGAGAPRDHQASADHPSHEHSVDRDLLAGADGEEVTHDDLLARHLIGLQAKSARRSS